MKHLTSIIFICLFCLSCSNSNKYQQSDLSVKEWGLGFSEDNIDNNVWGGTLYCSDEGIKWEPNTANEFVSKFFTGGKPWNVPRKDINNVCMVETTLKGIPVTSVEITTKKGKKYYLRTTLCLENNDLMNYLIDTYM